MSDIKFSVVIPAFNEEDYLPRLLDTIDEARNQYRNGPEAIEVIVSNNASTDKTAAIAAERGCTVATVETRCIAAVRNGGAALATGSILCFVDADMRVHPETFNAIEDTMESGKVIAGATGIKLERMSFGIFATLVLMMPPLWLFNIDSGVVFYRKKDFDTIGGYSEKDLIGEDVKMLLDLMMLGRKRGQRLKRIPSVKCLSSTRKWDEHGEWHFFAIIFHTFVGRFLFPKRFESLISKLWYIDYRTPPADRE